MNTSTSNKEQATPSAGAIRAAQAIDNEIWYDEGADGESIPNLPSEDTMARIIDREMAEDMAVILDALADAYAFTSRYSGPRANAINKNIEAVIVRYAKPSTTQ